MRNIKSMQGNNDGIRILYESILAKEIIKAITDWKQHSKDCVLIGGLALSYWAKPRYTQDADFLFIKKSDIPTKVAGFKQHRKGAFEHKTTGVEIKTLSPGYIRVPLHVAQHVFDTAIEKDGIKIASKASIVALKLYRYKLQDQADIETLLELESINLSLYKLDGVALTNMKHWNLTQKNKLLCK